MNLRKSVLLASAAMMFCQSAIAAPPFYWEDKGAFWKVSVSGNTPDSFVDFKIPVVLTKQQPKFCGYVKTKAFNDFDASYVYTSDSRRLVQPEAFNGKCSANIWKNSAGLSVTPPEYFKDAAGNLFIQSSTEIDLHFADVTKTVRRKTNACGVASFSFPKTWDNIQSFYAYLVVGGQYNAYDYEENKPMICKKVGNNFVRYVPLN